MRILFASILCAILTANRAVAVGEAFPGDEQSFPVLITLRDLAGKDAGTGSGFYFSESNKVYLVTARHVFFVDDAATQLRQPTAIVSSYSNDGSNSSKMIFTFNLAMLYQAGLIKTSPQHDIAAALVGTVSPLLDGTNGPTVNYSQGTTYLGAKHAKLSTFCPPFVGGYDDVGVGDDAFLFGYPSSLGVKANPKFDYDRPMLRKGMVAQKYKSARTVIIDAPVYPGNSGGPVVIIVSSTAAEIKYCIIGVVTEFIPYVDTWTSQNLGLQNHEVSNSGYSVVEPMDSVFEMIRH